MQNDQRAVAIDQKWLGRTAEAVLSAARAETAELSVLLVSDRRMRALNRRYRKKDRATDVLAFPMNERRSLAPAASVAAKSRLSSVPMLLGDVVISIPTATRQAKTQGHSVSQEVAMLLIHGVLHLCGYDHERGEREARLMRRKERAVLRSVSPLPTLVQ